MSELSDRLRATGQPLAIEAADALDVQDVALVALRDDRNRALFRARDNLTGLSAGREREAMLVGALKDAGQSLMAASVAYQKFARRPRDVMPPPQVDLQYETRLQAFDAAIERVKAAIAVSGRPARGDAEQALDDALAAFADGDFGEAEAQVEAARGILESLGGGE